MRYLRRVKIIETKTEWWSLGTGRKGKWGVTIYRVQFYKIKEGQKTDGGYRNTTVLMSLISLNCTLKSG